MPRETRSVSVLLSMHRFSTAPGDIDGGFCLACDVYLDLHQPNASDPKRIVGICERCGRWYLIDMAPATEEAVMVLLPDSDFFHDALGH